MHQCYDCFAAGRLQPESRRTWSASIPSSYPRLLRGAGSITDCSPICPRASIHVVRMASIYDCEVHHCGLPRRRLRADDWYGTPYTQALHVTEHYRLVDNDEAVKSAEERSATTNLRLARCASAATAIAVDRNYKGKVLQLQFTVDDPSVFTTPWSATVIYHRSSDEWPEHVCAENPGEARRHRPPPERAASGPQTPPPRSSGIKRPCVRLRGRG